MMNVKKTKISLTVLSLVAGLVITGFGGSMAFAMSNALQDTALPWYENYKSIMAAEQIYVNGEIIDGFPALYTRYAEIGGVFEENIYIPLRATAEKLGLNVTWDSQASAAAIGDIQIRQGENPNGYSGSTPQIFGGYLYISPSFFTEVLGKDLELTYKGIVRQETIQLGSQVYTIDLEENLETGTKWECFIDEKTGIILVDEGLGSEAEAADKTAIHHFTFKFPREYTATGEVVFYFEETLDGQKTGNKVVYTGRG